MPDAGSTIRAFSSEKPAPDSIAGGVPVRVRKARQTRQPLSRASVVAGTNAADVIAEARRTGEPSRSGDSHRSSSRRCWRRSRCRRSAAPTRPAPTPQPAERLGLSLRGGGRDRAGNGERGEGKSGNPGLDRHEKLHPVEAAPLWSACHLGRRRFRIRFESSPAGTSCSGIIVIVITDDLERADQAWGRPKASSRIEVIDLGEQFAERARAVIEQAFGLSRPEACVASPTAPAGCRSCACQANGAGPLRGRAGDNPFPSRCCRGRKLGDRLSAHAVADIAPA